MKHKRPTCINYGCEGKVTSSTMGRYRPFCSWCHHAGYGYRATYKRVDGTIKKYPPRQLREGVILFKTGKCSNQKHGQKGYLGFPCPMNYKKAPWAIGITELDHRDGDHTNNTIKNVQELCNPCHVKKSKLSGDLKRQTRYTYKRRQS